MIDGHLDIQNRESILEVLLLRQPKAVADLFVSEALRCTVVPVDQEIALAAAAASILHGLPTADALLYATAENARPSL